MVRFLSRFGWAVVLVILGAFVWFSIEISKPVEGTLQDDLVVGTVRHAPDLDLEGPLLGYVALFAGRPTDRRPAYPVDDRLPEQGRLFCARRRPPRRDEVLPARADRDRPQLFCETIALPEMRVDEDGKRVVASTGEPLPPKHVVVDTSTPCSYY